VPRNRRKNDGRRGKNMETLWKIIWKNNGKIAENVEI
jgi:hypothetical protein